VHAKLTDALRHAGASGTDRISVLASVPAAAITAFLLTITGAWIAAIIIVAVLASIVIHEAAHALAAKLVKVRTVEFFCGFGPRLVSIRRGHCDYGIKLIPAGGYVKLHPEDEARASRAATSFIAVAGPLANLALALVLLFAGAMAANADGPADAAGRSFAALRDTGAAMVAPITGLPEHTVTMVEGAATDKPVAAEQRILSPVGLGQVAGSAASTPQPLFMALVLVASVNIALALFNLVPIPPLDGGLILLNTIEGVGSRVARRPVEVPPRLIKAVSYAFVGFTLLATAAALVLDVTQPVPNPFA